MDKVMEGKHTYQDIIIGIDESRTTLAYYFWMNTSSKYLAERRLRYWPLTLWWLRIL